MAALSRRWAESEDSCNAEEEAMGSVGRPVVVDRGVKAEGERSRKGGSPQQVLV